MNYKIKTNGILLGKILILSLMFVQPNQPSKSRALINWEFSDLSWLRLQSMWIIS